MKSFSGLIDYNKQIFGVSYHDIIIEIDNKMNIQYGTKKTSKYGKYGFDVIGLILNEVIIILSKTPQYLIKFNKNEFSEEDVSFFVNSIHLAWRENFLYWYNNEIKEPFKKLSTKQNNFVRACTLNPYNLDDDIIQFYCDYMRCIMSYLIELQMAEAMNRFNFN